MRSRSALTVLFLSSYLALTPARAAAQSEPAAATSSPDEDKRLGDDAMVGLRYTDALGHYQRAYDTTKNPALRYNMGRAYEGLGDFPKALEALEDFATRASPELRARVPKLEQLLTDVRGRVSTITIQSNVEGAEIRLGEQVLGKTKQPSVEFKVNAGPRKLVVSDETHISFEAYPALAGGKTEVIKAVLASRATSAILRISSPVTGAVAAVDGRSVGVVPAEAVVSPGTHRVALTRSGYDTAETSIVISAGDTKSVDVPMASQDSVTKKWWFWTAIGVAVVGGGVATYVIATSEKDPSSGTIPPGQVKAQGFRF